MDNFYNSPALAQRRCVVCKKTIEGRKQCFGAPNVKLPCVEECFKAFHTKLNF